MKHLVPHVLIVLALAAWAGGHLTERSYLIVFALGHLAIPIWSAVISRRATRTRAVLLGPGTIIGTHALGLLITLLIALGGHDEGSWITLMIVMYWAAALAIYVIYCAIAFPLAARWSHRE